jgi:hypothetical protein
MGLKTATGAHCGGAHSFAIERTDAQVHGHGCVVVPGQKLALCVWLCERGGFLS